MNFKVISLTLAFLILTPLIPLYEYSEGYYEVDEELNLLELTEKNSESVLESIMTEDGFLLKPSLNTIEGDRSIFNEVFAYTVEPGDTLSSIAQRFGLKKETIMWENNLWNANQVKTGITLKILPVDGVSHLVKKGQTLASIVKKYKIDKEVLIKQNQLEDEALMADTLLIIPGAKKDLSTSTYTPSAPFIPPPGNFVAGKGRLLWPVGVARMTQGFARRHFGIDLANRAKGPIYAAASGKVVKVVYGWNGGYGNHVIIDHGDGMKTLYAHVEKSYVELGQYVDKGQTVAWMGSTGRSTGSHLHFEVWINGVKYNPMNFF